MNQGRLTGGRETPDGPLARSLALLVIGLILLVLGAVATSVLVLMLGVVCCIVGLCVSVAMTPRGPGRPG
ncbi:MAG: hypothetical protein ABS81_20300 [Pseudonocardia sp. SCN 72-86]|nr:MAG: hypothetical protein ABS81_20300 [Pseudonocardia sp. SCN 72-86]